MKNKSKKLGVCPQCRSNVRFKKPPQIGQFATCRRCHAKLEVVVRAPIELDWATLSQTKADNKKSFTKQRKQMRQQKQNIMFDEIL